MTWHVDSDLLDRYASKALTAAGMASVEMHVTGCATCRSEVTSRADARAQARVKQALDERLDTPPASRLERSLRRVGVDDADARVIGAAMTLHGSWLIACVLTLAFGVVAATTGPERAGLAAFLVAAPLVPLAGVAVAYGRGVDPTFEIAAAAAMPSARVVMLRILAVTAPVIPAIVALSLFLTVGPLAFAWLLPALALATLSLALGTVMPLSHAAVGLAAVWLTVTTWGLVGAPRTSAEAFVSGAAAFGPSGQLLFGSLTAMSLVVVALRRTQFEIGR